jgi:uncharacterized protein YegP (UPF0339 family)
MEQRGEVYKRADGLYDWRVKAANNATVATSGGQGFTERNDAREAVEAVFPGIGVEDVEEGE